MISKWTKSEKVFLRRQPPGTEVSYIACRSNGCLALVAIARGIGRHGAQTGRSRDMVTLVRQRLALRLLKELLPKS
jgi:hypothetical protein